MAKYDPLRERLASDGGRVVTMSFAQIRAELGIVLPPVAFRNRTWWSNNPERHVQAQAWLGAGFEVDSIDLGIERVRFVRSG